jgi:hypothetical protein
LENFFFYGICHGLAALILNQCQHTKFTKAADGTQNVHFALAVP